MSHHLLRQCGGEREVSAPFTTRGRHHCDYMEQLRRSVAQLRHQTARGSPASCSRSRRVPTPCQTSFGVPKCLIVYEPHDAVRENQAAAYKQYANSSCSSSSSGAGSSLAGKLEDVSDIFEDSGVDLGFSNLQSGGRKPNRMDYVSPQQKHEGQEGKAAESRDGQSKSTAQQSGANPSPSQLPEFGGVCFCAVEVRRKKTSSSCNSGHINAPHDEQETVTDDSQGAAGKHGNAVMAKEHCRARNPLTNLFPGEQPYLPNGSLVSSTKVKDVTYVDMSKGVRPALERYALAGNNVRRHSEDGIDTDDDSDDTPTTTPTPEANDTHANQDGIAYRCHSQTDHCANGTITVQAEVHQGDRHTSKRGKSQNVEEEAEYVQADCVFATTTDGDWHRHGDKERIQAKHDAGSNALDIRLPSGLHRSSSVTSLISMTDTMSVTSLEVANLMAVSSRDDKKSVVKLEKERLQLQHQRLESYQNYADDSMRRNAWTEQSRKPYSDDSLKKQKIFQSVLGSLPTSATTKGVIGQSNLHHFVTQSLQSFFDTGSSNSGDGHTAEKGSQGRGLDPYNNKVPGINGKCNNHRNYEGERQPRSGTGNYMNAASSPKAPDQSVPLPSLFQLTASFRLFHVVYGDWTDLRNLRLYLSDIILEENSTSPIGSSKSPGSTSRSTGSSSRSSGGSPGGRSVLSTDSGAFRTVGKVSPNGRYTFLIISYLGNPRMELDTGGLQVGDHIIEVNDICLLNKTPEAFYGTLRKLDQVHLVIGRRRRGVSVNHRASCDSFML